MDDLSFLQGMSHAGGTEFMELPRPLLFRFYGDYKVVSGVSSSQGPESQVTII